MIRTYKQFTIAAGGTPQPLVGTTITNAIAAGDNVQITVGDSTMFRAKGWALVDGGTAASKERTLVLSVDDATHITVQHLDNAHAAGKYIQPSEQCQSVYIQPKDGNAAALFVGNSPVLVKATLAFVIKVLQKVAAAAQANDMTLAVQGGQDNLDLAEIWVDGTTADGYLPSCVVL